MRVHFDEETDAVYFRLDDSPVADSEEVRPGVVLDFNERNEVVGVEILRAGKRVPPEFLKQIQFEIA